jgi:hypothetical protein
MERRLLDWYWSVSLYELPPQEVDSAHDGEDRAKADGNGDSSILANFRSLLVIDTRLTRNDSKQRADYERRKQSAKRHFVTVCCSL